MGKGEVLSGYHRIASFFAITWNLYAYLRLWESDPGFVREETLVETEPVFEGARSSETAPNKTMRITRSKARALAALAKERAATEAAMEAERSLDPLSATRRIGGRKGSKSKEEDDLQICADRYCYTCEGVVRGHDHHCVWLKNCIGSNNWQPFVLFLATHAAMCLYGIYLTLSILRFDAIYRGMNRRKKAPYPLSWHPPTLASTHFGY
ncbi:DHHC palmitoyltransferase [Gregarina niphandrodes]|uniref:Palmitoyltransferase n=1 Tax=Gregarina niphandrodes TaxID=110365 RepID=A0A023B7H9_GRENI|nr:DHHC palmitoyltransferase [Gregarina niphandrodes]EZG67360.1 DHHC palmitoyltransferase [Gregarina niphandrodes]|eukprot:XP_011130261.1 DHHC palmitoyltransferase [Gregarina niphandrodes]